MDEKNLIKKLKKKDQEAYVELINLYGNRLLRTLYLMLGDEKEGTIKSRLSRGRQELKKALEKGGSFHV